MWISRGFLVTGLAGLLASPLAAAEPEIDARQNVWAIGFQLRPLQFRGDENQQLKMNSSTIDVSRVWLKKTWWASVDASLVVGPWSQRRSVSPPLDFSGSGFGARLAYPLFADQLRQESGDFGLTIGLETFDMIGRSYRRQNLDNDSYSEGWTVRARWTGILPGVFYSSLKPGRPKGNRPEWLVTRVEGYTFVLSSAFPIDGQIKQKFTFNGLPLVTNEPLKGYALQLAFSAWLGI